MCVADVWKKEFFTLSQLVSVLTPFFVRQFVLIPVIYWLLLGEWAAHNALVSMLLAEALTNVHSFIVIVTNHAGNDLYRFDGPCVPRSGEFYMRQVISCVSEQCVSSVSLIRGPLVFRSV